MKIYFSRTHSFFASSLLLISCQGKDITSTWVDKEMPTTTQIAPAMPAPADHTHNSIQWTKPTEWQDVPPSNMRVASFSFKGKTGRTADISVVRLAGEGGGVLANINRWRGQLQLSPLSEPELQKATAKEQVDNHLMLVVDFSSAQGAAEPARMIAAIYALGNESWYFKMTGDSKTLEESKGGFLKFIRSVKHPH